MQCVDATRFHAFGFKNGVGFIGYLEYWHRSFDAPLFADEAIDSLIYRERCGCLGDLRFHDAVWRGKLHYGEQYVCPKCRATWLIGIA